jgi:hypothetical protein
VDRRAKVELFEQIRREYEHGGGTIRGIAKKLGIHRRMVREAVCVKKTRKRRAVRKMKVGPSESPCRRRLQTAISCYEPKLVGGERYG